MRKLIKVLLFIVSFNLSAQEMFTDLTTQDQYLFLGSIKGEQRKVLNLQNKTIQWIDNNQLEQTDILSPESFSKKIFDSKLAFQASGDEPFWSATIFYNKLLFLAPTTPDGKPKEYIIKLDTINNLITYSYVSMFRSKDNSVYGVIRSQTVDSPCELAISDETSIFEVFINYQGDIFKGCATVDKELFLFNQ